MSKEHLLDGNNFTKSFPAMSLGPSHLQQRQFQIDLQSQGSFQEVSNQAAQNKSQLTSLTNNRKYIIKYIK